MKKFNKNKKLTTIALILTLTIAATFMTYLPITAQEKGPSYGFVNVSPRTAGIHQTIVVNAWTSPVPPDAYMGAPLYDKFRTGYMFTFTKPDGTTDIKGPYSSYADGTVFLTYAPDQTGTWSVVLYWPGDDIFEGVTSPPFTFTVQTEAEAPWPEVGLPTEYWQRPVNAENHAWSQLLADWPSSSYDARNSNFNPYSPAPESAHILWKRVDNLGGIMGGEWGPAAYRAAVSPVVMGGRVYYSAGGGLRCVDIFTGEEYWTEPVPGRPYYVTLDADPDPGGAMVHADLWTTSGADILIYSGSTGKLSKTYADTGFTISAYHDGYFYSLVGKNWTKWDPYSIGTAGYREATFKEKIVWSVNITGANPSYYWEDIAVASYAEAAYNLTTGELMWSEDRGYTDYYWRTPAVGYGKFCQADVNMTWYGFNLYTGAEDWATENLSEYPFGAFWAYSSASAYDKAYGQSYDGHIYAIDVNDGHVVWSFYSGDSHGQTPFGTWPFWNNPAIADGKVYASTTEHTPTQPRFMGYRLYCIDDNTGNEIWSIAGAYAAEAIADGMLLASNEYDSELYCFGKGPTKTTVTIKNDVVAKGNKVLITGTVTDDSPGTKKGEVAVRFPAGVPAVSEASMTAWMEYLHMQKPRPMDTTGVPVTLAYVDPNGKYGEIATVTSDTEGFRVEWTPEIEGIYQVIATFDGTTSYYSSHASTAILVGPAPSPAGPIELEPTEPTEAPLITTEVAIIAAVAVAAVIGLGAFWFLRKRQ